MFIDFSNILEYVPTTLPPKSINKKNKLVYEISKFIKNYKINDDTIIISLSGGVDSMVVAYIIQHLTNPNKNIVAIHINYHNRTETIQEQKFIEEWCNLFNIKLHILDFSGYLRNDIERNEYEEKTRKQRFDIYNQIIHKYNASGIFIGHHANDVAENVFCNVMHGRNIIDLSVITDISIVDNVKLFRPFRNIFKKDIIQFAHDNNIPYFKNSTPEWSNRGKLRNEIFPSIEKQFGNGTQKQLYNIAKQSDELKEIVMMNIIDPYIKTITENEHNIILPLQGYQNKPKIFWNMVLMKKLHSIGKPMAKNGEIDFLIEKIKKISNTNNSTSHTQTIKISINGKPAIIKNNSLIIPK